ncbi:MAG TPA: hypothetical protein QGF35_09185 [Dehalococcoidia bacterium]|nr:hypothetical protein [Dehalococcoidia bacterium]
MQITRVHMGNAGESHFEDLEVPLLEGRYGAISEFWPLSGVAFRVTQPRAELDFHNAPRRQFVVTLEGLAEIECARGETRRFGPGDILLADDVDSHGHITREIEGPRRSLFLALDPNFGSGL